MKVLIIGGGGREHALAWKVAQSELVERVYVAPGNAGTALEPRVENIAIAADDIHALARFAEAQRIDLTIVGPEVPLVMGITDLFAQRGLKCFGPSQKAAQLEGSKTFAKSFMQRHAIPSAAYQNFTVAADAIAHLAACAYPLVLKADGLASGKGVVIAESRAQAEQAIMAMLSENQFGAAGKRVLIEEFLHGEEVSFICMVDGEHILPMATSQDHKAAYDGDTGPNTGGMGAYSPAPIDDAMHAHILTAVIEPTVAGMAADGMRYTGFLYAGLMIDDGAAKVLEFNCRFGDPETQPIMLRLRSDLVAHCLAAMDGTLEQQTAMWDSRAALGVVIAARGYPHNNAKQSDADKVMFGLDAEDDDDDDDDNDDAIQKIFHAATHSHNGKIIAGGGRVLCATALGDQVQDAQRRAYALAKSVHWQGCWYRTDIGHRAIRKYEST